MFPLGKLFLKTFFFDRTAHEGLDGNLWGEFFANEFDDGFGDGKRDLMLFGRVQGGKAGVGPFDDHAYIFFGFFFSQSFA